MFTGAENTSFIPKKNTTSKVERKSTIDIGLVVAMIIFLVILFSSLSVFLYKNFLKNKIEESSVILDREKNNFDIDSINQFSRLGERIKISEILLNKHLDLTGLFEILEANTLKTIQFKTFDFSVDETGVYIVMEGTAKDYSTVALQSDIFGDVSSMKDLVFSNLDVNDQGRVVFNFSATIDGDLVSYKKRIE